MSHRVDSRRGTEQRGRRVGARPTLANPLEPVADRPRRIDSCIDYFGTGDARFLSHSSDSCGESLLDEGERVTRGPSAGPAMS